MEPERPAPPQIPAEKPELPTTSSRPERLVKTTKARYLRNPTPEYPSEARRLHQEGVALLRVQVSAKGRVEGVELERSSGTSSLDEAAIKGVRSWEFEPARRGDTPIASTVTVPVRFRFVE